MSDETPSRPLPMRPAETPPGGGRRAGRSERSDPDPEVARALAVAALPETTRRRLVTTALGEATLAAGPDDAAVEAPGRRIGRLTAALGVAAALVVGAVVGTAIVTQPDDPTPTAARAPATSAQEDAAAAAPDPAGATDPGDAESPLAAAAPPIELGDLGLVTDADSVKAAVRPRLAAAQADASKTTAKTPCAIDASKPGKFGLVTLTAAGTATRDGSAIVILVGTTRTREGAVVILDPARACQAVELIRL